MRKNHRSNHLQKHEHLTNFVVGFLFLDDVFSVFFLRGCFQLMWNLIKKPTISTIGRWWLSVHNTIFNSPLLNAKMTYCLRYTSINGKCINILSMLCLTAYTLYITHKTVFFVLCLNCDMHCGEDKHVGFTGIGKRNDGTVNFERGSVQGWKLGLFGTNCENLAVFKSSLAANIFFDLFEYFWKFGRILASFACVATFRNFNTQKVSMYTVTSTLPFLTIEITQFNIPMIVVM